MPNPPKKLLIFAAEKELVLQPWNDVNHQYSVRIQFEDVSITKGAKAHCDEYKERPSLLSYGIIGTNSDDSFQQAFTNYSLDPHGQALADQQYVCKDYSILNHSLSCFASHVGKG